MGTTPRAFPKLKLPFITTVTTLFLCSLLSAYNLAKSGTQLELSIDRGEVLQFILTPTNADLRSPSSHSSNGVRAVYFDLAASFDLQGKGPEGFSLYLFPSNESFKKINQHDFVDSESLRLKPFIAKSVVTAIEKPMALQFRPDRHYVLTYFWGGNTATNSVVNSVESELYWIGSEFGLKRLTRFDTGQTIPIAGYNPPIAIFLSEWEKEEHFHAMLNSMDIGIFLRQFSTGPSNFIWYQLSPGFTSVGFNN